MKKVIVLFVYLFITLFLCSANAESINLDTKILPLDYKEQNYQKYNSQIQKYFSLFPPNNEALLENGNTLVVRYKNSNDAKWQYEKFPLYWRELTTINLKNADYIVIRTVK